MMLCLSSGVAREGVGGWLPLAETLPPSCPQMKLHFVQWSMESHYCESQSAPLLTPEPPLPPPHFKKSGYAPVLVQCPGGGGNSSLVLVGKCCWEFEIGFIHIPTFQERVTHSYTNLPNFGWNFDQSYLIFFEFSQIVEKIQNLA